MMEDIETSFLALVEHLTRSDLPFQTELGPLIFAAASLNVAADTRSFARLFETAHALVIRECVHLADELELLILANRGEKSGRIFFVLADKGKRIADEIAS